LYHYRQQIIVKDDGNIVISLTAKSPEIAIINLTARFDRSHDPEGETNIGYFLFSVGKC
jgi:hypothetical protein